MKTINTKKGKSAKEEVELENSTQTDAFALLGKADALEDESIIFYQNLKDMFPQWTDALDDLIKEEVNHRGVLAALRESINPQLAETLKDGVKEGNDNLYDDEALRVDSEAVEKALTEEEKKALLVNKAFEDEPLVIEARAYPEEAGIDGGVGFIFEESKPKNPASLFIDEEELDEINNLFAGEDVEEEGENLKIYRHGDFEIHDYTDWSDGYYDNDEDAKEDHIRILQEILDSGYATEFSDKVVIFKDEKWGGEEETNVIENSDGKKFVWVAGRLWGEE